MKSVNQTAIPTQQSMKPRSSRSKSREVSSRFLSPSSTSSPNHSPSPGQRKSTVTDTPKYQSSNTTSFTSSSSSSSSSNSNSRNSSSLADHLGNERLKDFLDRKINEKSSSKKSNGVFSFSRQRSCTEFSRFEKEIQQSEKENHRPSVFGGSMRYTGKYSSPLSSSSSNSNSLWNNYNSNVIPGRLSVGENTLYGKPNRKNSDLFANNFESEANCSEICSSLEFDDSPNISRRNSDSSPSFRRYGKEVSSRYMQDLSSRVPRRMNSDSNIQIPISLYHSSQKLKTFTIKNAIKRNNSQTSKNSTSQWALSPGRSGSPPMTVESKHRPMSFSNLKPPTSPSRMKGVERLLNLGLDLFRNKKSRNITGSPSLLGSGVDVESIHWMRMLHNRLIQWRFANAKADVVNAKVADQVEKKLMHASASLTELQHSVLQKKLQLQKGKLEIKLDFILQSQMNPLESWRDMESQHLLAVSMITEDLHSAVCRVPLVEGATVNPQSATTALQHATDLTSSVKSLLASFSPWSEKTVTSISKLAEVVSQERLILEECLELLRDISLLEIQERSLKCYMIQLESRERQRQQEQQKEESLA